jgi:hypothetical protein
MKWITASRLEQWAQTLTSEVDLAGVVGDLIRASSSDITACRFPSGDKGRTRGFDGHLVSNISALNVPEGCSYWEFGTLKDYRQKAVNDLKARTAEIDLDIRKETTFVIVTPRTWDSSKQAHKIESWIEARKREFIWKDIVVIDGVSLETWLQSCPAVAGWHAKNTIKCAPLAGVRSTAEFWEEFAHRFNPMLTEEVLLCERSDASEQLVRTLLGHPDTIKLSADSPDEVVAFAIAAIRKAKPEVRLFLEARTLVIDTMAAGRELLVEDNLVFLLRDDAAQSPGQFAARGPTLVALGRQQRNGKGQALVRPSGHEMGMAMRTMGLPENEAITMARGCGRSLSALARRIPGGCSPLPNWSKNGTTALPAILAGAWDGTNELDQSILKVLAGTDDYFKYEKQLRPFLPESDPAFDLEGSVWKVRAPMDAFIHAGHLLGQEHLGILRSVMTTVFGTVEQNPDPDRLAGFLDKPLPAYSAWLRDGLATTLLLVAVWGKETSLGGDSGQRFADELVTALPGLFSNHRLLASLRDELPVLAEAAPNPLLAALEQMLEGNAEAIRPIFNEIEGLVFPTSRHTGLLWALETLSWDPAYFRRAVLVLARLAAIDPGGSMSNRPINSLKEVFIPWKPNTNASQTQRLATLDEIVALTPQTGWSLILRLLPGEHTLSTNTARPKLRDAGASERGKLTNREYLHNQSEIVRRAIKLAGTDPLRWRDVVPAFSNFQPEERQAALSAIDATLAGISGQNYKLLWAKLRDEVVKHKKYTTAKWALPPSELAPLAELVDRFAPEDPVAKIAWMFDNWTFDTISDIKIADHRRADAMQLLFRTGGVEAVAQLGQEAKQPSLVIEAITAAKIDARDIELILGHGLQHGPTSNFTIGLAGHHCRLVGALEAEKWLKRALSSPAFNDETAGLLLLAWPDDTSTWHVGHRLGPEVEKVYWERKLLFGFKGTKRAFYRAIVMLLRAGRASVALQMAFDRLAELPSHLLLRILDDLIPELNAQSKSSDAMVSHNVEQAFAELDKRLDITESALGQREFAFLPLLEFGGRSLRLHKLMASNPEFFHQVIRDVFRGNNEPKAEPDAATQVRARMSYSLLSQFTLLPGLKEDTTIDTTILSSWVDKVRVLGTETGRAEITDQYVGHIFAHAPKDVDGSWPHRTVRGEIERVASVELERGIQTERFNMRGAYSKPLYQGGVQERALAAEYDQASVVADAWPRTAALLREIATSWKEDAEREDVRAAQQKLRS